MRVLVACEFSGVVRDAFRARGHDAYSIDLEPCEADPRWHFQGDVLAFNDLHSWDLLIAHPPCTFLAHSGIRWLYIDGKKSNGRNEARWMDMRQGCRFFLRLWQLPIKRKAIENPQMHPYAKQILEAHMSHVSLRLNSANALPLTQFVQPHMFGIEEFKRTGFTLDNLPPLIATNQIRVPVYGTEEYKRWSRVHRASPGPDRWKERSRTLPAIADAMADQWGVLTPSQIYDNSIERRNFSETAGEFTKELVKS